MGILKNDYLVSKRNILNEIRTTNLKLTELRFFSIYLSKINPLDVNTRSVKFSLKDFQKIMELGRINIDYMKQVTNNLLGKVINIPTESGGYHGFQIFKECEVDVDEKGEWYVKIDAHDRALPLLFDFKERYFTYSLWNALSLKSKNQLRMYEILKQYQKIGWRIVPLVELRDLLGIEKEEYLLYNNFKVYVLDVCQKALRASTDIKFEYEPYGKRGRGGKILTLKFNIFKNEDYSNQLYLDDFLEETIDQPEVELPVYEERIEFFLDACNNEFSFNEMKLINTILAGKMSDGVFTDKLKVFNHLLQKYQEMNLHDKEKRIRKRFNYYKAIIEADNI